jgi:Uma2 family endonuclease
VKLAEDRFAVPDVAVIPRRLVEAWRRRPHELEEYSEPLPLVVEVWSRSTGGYDVDHKLPAYRARGDLEIWRIHPYERTVMVWRKDADGDYAEELHRTGGLHISSLPACRIDLDRLFAAIDS